MKIRNVLLLCAMIGAATLLSCQQGTKPGVYPPAWSQGSWSSERDEEMGDFAFLIEEANIQFILPFGTLNFTDDFGIENLKQKSSEESYSVVLDEDGLVTEFLFVFLDEKTIEFSMVHEGEFIARNNMYRQ